MRFPKTYFVQTIAHEGHQDDEIPNIYNDSSLRSTKKFEIIINKESSEIHPIELIPENNAGESPYNLKIPAYHQIKNYFIQSLLSINVSNKAKISIFCFKIALVHFCAFGFTLLKYFQNFFYFSTEDCYSDFQEWIFSVVTAIFTLYGLITCLFLKCSIHIFYEGKSKMLVSILFIFLNFLTIFALMTTTSTTENNPTFIISTIYYWTLIFQIKNLVDSKFSFKQWILNLLKTHSVTSFFLAHYSVCFFILPIISHLLAENLGLYLTKNILSFIYFMYFSLYSFLFSKLSCYYYEFLKSLNKNSHENLIWITRYNLSYTMGVPISNIINIEYSDWGCWILLISYANFLISGYIGSNLLLIALKKVLVFFRFKKFIIENKPTETEKLCSMLLSGSILDIILIITCRLIMIDITGKWILGPVYRIYYVGCTYYISHYFKTTKMGIYSTVGINLAITLLIFVYMIFKKTKLFEYFILKNSLINFVMIFFLHIEIECSLQLMYNVKQIDS